MIGLAYTSFVVPIPNANEYNAFVTNLALSHSLKGRLSTSSSRFSFASLGSFIQDIPDNPEIHNNGRAVDDDRDENGNGNDMVRRRSSKRGGVLKKLRVLVGGRVRLRRMGYAPIKNDAIEMQ